jgi:carboxylesterase type B
MQRKQVRWIYIGPGCMADPGDLINAFARISEDCLQLNVIIPASAKPGANLPVIGHVYGGKVNNY